MYQKKKNKMIYIKKHLLLRIKEKTPDNLQKLSNKDTENKLNGKSLICNLNINELKYLIKGRN